MTPTIPNLAKLRRSPILPLLVLLLALSSVFLFSNERGHFYRYSAHGVISGNYMAIIANLSLEDGLLGYYHERLVSDDGATRYHLNNRFPLGGFILTKLATLPFGGSLSAQIYAAQTAMLLFYAAAALMAYLSLSRLTGRPWIALAAVLLAFSSFIMLYYGDIICTEVSPSFFGVMLAFHGIAVFAQERRFPQLLLKSCAALLLGWHVYALLLPFIIFGISAELIDAFRPPPRSPLSRARRLASALFHSRCLLLGAATLAFGAALLTFNFANEYRVLDGETAFTELPSVESMLRRGAGIQSVDQEAELAPPLSEIWPLSRIIEQQFYRIGIMSAPFALPGYESAWEMEFRQRWVITGIAVFAACVAALAFTRRKMLWATLALYGFFWALPLRYQVVFHEFEAMHYIGIPLIVFTFALMWISRRSNDRLTPVAVVAAALVFALSASLIARIGYHPDDHARHTQALADFDAIRPITDGKIVYVPPPFRDPKGIGGRSSEDFYLAGRVIVIDGNLTERADFVVSARRLPATQTLTPQNHVAFLYRQADYARWHESALTDAAGPPRQRKLRHLHPRKRNPIRQARLQRTRRQLKIHPAHLPRRPNPPARRPPTARLRQPRLSLRPPRHPPNQRLPCIHPPAHIPHRHHPRRPKNLRRRDPMANRHPHRPPPLPLPPSRLPPLVRIRPSQHIGPHCPRNLRHPPPPKRHPIRQTKLR